MNKPALALQNFALDRFNEARTERLARRFDRHNGYPPKAIPLCCEPCRRELDEEIDHNPYLWFEGLRR